MKPNVIEIGERYSDDSGWERRVLLDRHEQKFVIDLGGAYLSAHPREIPWLIEALKTAHDAIYFD